MKRKRTGRRAEGEKGCDFCVLRRWPDGPEEAAKLLQATNSLKRPLEATVSTRAAALALAVLTCLGFPRPRSASHFALKRTARRLPKEPLGVPAGIGPASPVGSSLPKLRLPFALVPKTCSCSLQAQASDRVYRIWSKKSQDLQHGHTRLILTSRARSLLIQVRHLIFGTI